MQTSIYILLFLINPSYHLAVIAISDFDVETASSGKKHPSRSNKHRDDCQGSNLS